MSNLIKKEDVANWMFENRMCTSIHNAYDKLKELPMVDLADHDKQIIDKFVKHCENGIPYDICDGNEAMEYIREIAEQMKGEHI